MSEAGEYEGRKYYKTTEQQIVGDERFIDKVDRKLKRAEKLLRKVTIKEIEQAVEECVKGSVTGYRDVLNMATLLDLSIVFYQLILLKII